MRHKRDMTESASDVADDQMWDKQIRHHDLHVLRRALHWKTLLAIAIIAMIVLVAERYGCELCRK